MANLFKKRTTRPLPTGAELFTKNGERFARWTPRGGKPKTARVTGDGDAARIQCESGTWYCRVRMADGSRLDVSTGCRDKSAALARMTALENEQERIKAGVITASEAKTAKHGHRAYADMVADFTQGMAARGCSAEHAKKTRALLEGTADALGWRVLRDVNRADLERWLAMRASTPRDEKKPDSIMGARTHNAYVTAFKAFGAWCVRQGYVKAHPFVGVLKRSEKADRRHIRRALTPDELRRLIEAARVRPMQEAIKINRGPNKGTPRADISPETRDHLRWLGETRAMAYWTAAATGLRWGELRSITLGACRLDADPPHLILEARHEKARRGATLPVTESLAAALRDLLPNGDRVLWGILGALLGIWAL